jgi:dynein heavy chain, axonemal
MYFMQMVPMMEKIALEMCERVSRVIDVRSLFQSPASIVKVRALEAVEMMNLWKSAYFETRAKIEATGRDARWEFDRRRLFEKTNHIAGICKDLAGVAQASKVAIAYI